MQTRKSKVAFSKQKEIKLWQNLHKIGCVHPSQNCKSAVYVLYFINAVCYRFLKRKRRGGYFLLNQID